MPHNLYLHSSIAQTRHYPLTVRGEREAIFLGTIDSTVALLFALFINAAILIVTGASFYRSGHHEVAEIQDAYKLLRPLVGVGVASTLFAVACWPLARNSTLTSTLTEQVVMEGFLRIRLPPVLRRLITRLLAIISGAVIVTATMGESGAAQPLIFQPSDPEYAVKVRGWFLGVTIAALSAFLLWQTFAGSGS